MLHADSTRNRIDECWCIFRLGFKQEAASSHAQVGSQFRSESQRAVTFERHARRSKSILNSSKSELFKVGSKSLRNPAHHHLQAGTNLEMAWLPQSLLETIYSTPSCGQHGGVRRHRHGALYRATPIRVLQRYYERYTLLLLL